MICFMVEHSRRGSELQKRGPSNLISVKEAGIAPAKSAHSQMNENKFTDRLITFHLPQSL